MYTRLTEKHMGPELEDGKKITLGDNGYKHELGNTEMPRPLPLIDG